MAKLAGLKKRVGVDLREMMSFLVSEIGKTNWPHLTMDLRWGKVAQMCGVLPSRVRAFSHQAAPINPAELYQMLLASERVRNQRWVTPATATQGEERAVMLQLLNEARYRMAAAPVSGDMVQSG
ncbi:hypothetical protein [Acidisphaera sp. L21]|uniref:hypothetical protein n=1 Tax=Acidisphaera sp. L21 TaxID=1641851 RepID=UPI00131C3E7F|nr:hypothetical protein [Acidisphaera sp. L21]